MSNVDMILEPRKYCDFIVYSVITIKKKYGYRIKLIYEDGTNEIIQKSGYKTIKEANSKREVSITELHNGTFVIEKNITVEFYFTYWLEKVMRPNLTADSYDSYKNVVYNHINPKFGKMKLTNLSRNDIKNFYEEKAEFSHSVTKLCKTVIKTAIKYAFDNKLIRIDIAKDVKLPKGISNGKYRTREIDSKKTLNIGQVQILIEKAKETPIYLQVMFAVLMGLRKSEINGLKYADIDFIHRKLYIQRQLGKKANTDNSELKKGEYTKQDIDVKTFSSKRELDIPDILFEAILEEKKKYEKNKSRRINDKTTPFKDYDYIICSSYGNPRSKGFHFEYWKQLLKDCNLPNIRFHDLRATYCTLLLKNNFSEKAISKLMGHATEIISVDVYGDNDEIISDCIEELEPFIAKVAPAINNAIIDADFSNDNEIIDIINGYLTNLKLGDELGTN